jgi:UDP-2,3-diacylglucosamine hydrolase
VSAAGPVALIAGGGSFPAEVTHAAVAAGHSVRILGLRGFAGRRIAGLPVEPVDLLDPAGILKALRAIAPACVVLAGSVTRPGPLAIASVFTAFRNREELGRILGAGDDRILRGAIGIIEQAGFPVVGAHEVAPGLLAPGGCLTRRLPDDAETADIALGARLLCALGPFDVGQGAVVSQGRVLAVEGPEGTDAMLERVAGLQRRRRVRLDGRGAVLVKIPKPGQDRRVDLPAIGPRTVAKAVAARLTGIAVAAGGVVIIDRPATIEAADRKGLFLVGIPAESPT